MDQCDHSMHGEYCGFTEQDHLRVDGVTSQVCTGSYCSWCISASMGERKPTADSYRMYLLLQIWTAKLLQQALQDTMQDLSDELCGLLAGFDELWYVEEHDLLALGLGGSHVKHASALHCRL